MRLHFFVSGIPIAQGSLKGFPIVNRRTGRSRVILTSTAKGLKPWREAVAYAAREAMRRAGVTMTHEAVAIGLTFVLPRPKRLSATRPTPRHKVRLDLDKAVRAIGDAGSGILWKDDAQIDDYLPMPGRWKRYAEPGEATGVEIRVEMDGGR